MSDLADLLDEMADDYGDGSRSRRAIADARFHPDLGRRLARLCAAQHRALEQSVCKCDSGASCPRHEAEVLARKLEQQLRRGYRKGRLR